MNALRDSRFSDEVTERAYHKAERRVAERNRDPQPWPDDGSVSGIAAMVLLVLLGLFAIVGVGAYLVVVQ